MFEGESHHHPTAGAASGRAGAGREAYLQTLEPVLLADHHETTYVLEGAAGVGKTALAGRLAYRLRPYLPDGVLWARLDTSNPMSILRLFAAAYERDVTAYDDLESRSAAVRALLADKRALIVLDNAQSSQEIQPLLPPSGSCAILVTTRRRHLALTGARRFHLEPFAVEETLVLFARMLLESSYPLLAPEQQHFLATLGTFGGEDFSVEAAAAVAGVPVGEAEANFRQLFGLSLVRRGRPGRYRLTPVLQSFAREKIGRDDVWERASAACPAPSARGSKRSLTS